MQNIKTPVDLPDEYHYLIPKIKEAIKKSDFVNLGQYAQTLESISYDELLEAYKKYVRRKKNRRLFFYLLISLFLLAGLLFYKTIG